MASFEFYGAEKFASCQYHGENFFVVLDATSQEYPMLRRARSAFEKLHDEVFVFAKGETQALENELSDLVQELKIDLHDPPQKYKVLAFLLPELEAVFTESQLTKTDIKFRWG